MTLKAKVESLDDVAPEFHPLYEKKGEEFVLLPIEGMKPQAEFDTVHTALAKERLDHKAAKSKLTAFGAVKPEEIVDLQNELEELRLLKSGDVDEAKIAKLVDTRVQQRVQPLQRKLTEAEQQATQLQGEVEGFRNKERNMSIRDGILAAATKEKLRTTAVDDAVLAGTQVFELTEDGNVVTRGDVKGVSAGLTPEQWLIDMRKNRPHWWPESGGGGGRAGGGGGGTVNPWSKAAWNLTEQSKIYRDDPARAAMLAKNAGSKVGASSPPDK